MYGYRGGRGRYQPQRPRFGTRKEIVKVPSDACGLIVGKGGRNVKELKASNNGIDHIRVDFQRATVEIVGAEDGIAAAKRRIDQAVCLSANSAGYFPEKALTCLRLERSYSTIQFYRVATEKSDIVGGVRTEQLDVHRKYFAISVVAGEEETDLTSHLGALSLKEPTTENHRESIILGYNASTYMSFFDDIFRSNVSALTTPAQCAEVGINFGKTFLSSIPVGFEGRKIPLKELSQMQYGKSGIRPEFVRHFTVKLREAFIRAIRDDSYELLSSGKFVIVHCVSKMTNKRYTIKLRHRQDENTQQDGNEARDAATDRIRQIASAKTYFEVLGLSASNYPLRQVKIAYQRIALLVHPDKSSHPLAKQAMTVLNEARETLTDDTEMESYRRRPAAQQRPKNNFEFSGALNRNAKPLPDVEEFRSKVKKLGLCTVLSEVSRSEFRTTIEIEKDEARLDHDMRQKLQDAWEKREQDKFCFPNDGKDDWLIVETVRYKDSEKFTNGSFIVTLDRATEEHFGKAMDGINISLKSADLNDELASLKTTDKESYDGEVSRISSYMRDLQSEAARLSSYLDNASTN